MSRREKGLADQDQALHQKRNGRFYELGAGVVGVAVGVGVPGVGVEVEVGVTVGVVAVLVAVWVVVAVPAEPVAVGVVVGVEVHGNGWVGTGTCSVRELFCSLLSATAPFGSTVTVIAAPV